MHLHNSICTDFYQCDIMMEKLNDPMRAASSHSQAYREITMTSHDIMSIINGSLFADLGYLNQNGKPAVSRFYCVWRRGIGSHLISTGSFHNHAICLANGGDACLYFADEPSFTSILLTGRASPTCDRRLKQLIWYEGDEAYFPRGLDDPGYCVIEFKAESLTWYHSGSKGAMNAEEIAEFDVGRDYENRHAQDGETL